LIFLSIIGAVLLFIIPYFLNRLQKLELDKNAEMLKIISKEYMEHNKKEIIETTNNRIHEELLKSKEDIQKEIKYTTAMSHYIQAKFEEEKNIEKSLIGYIKSISFQLQSEKYFNLNMSVERLVHVLNTIGNTPLDPEIKKRIDHVISKLEEKNNNGLFSIYIKDIQNCLK
jgi:hypothetical protein